MCRRVGVLAYWRAFQDRGVSPYADTPLRSAYADTPLRFPFARLERIVGNNNGGPASINMPTRAQLGDGMFAVFFEQQCCSGGDQTPNYKKDRKN
jgi:hypothetical protein